MVRKLGHEAKGLCKACWYSYSPGIMFLTMKLRPSALFDIRSASSSLLIVGFGSYLAR